MTSPSYLIIFQTRWRCVNTVVDAESNMEKKKAIVAILVCLFILDNACEGKGTLILEFFFTSKLVLQRKTHHLIATNCLSLFPNGVTFSTSIS